MTDTLDTPIHASVPDGAHVLPSGTWVLLGDPKQLTRGDKKQIVLQANAEGLTSIDSGYVIYEALVCKLVTAWSYALPLPAEDAASIDQIPIVDDTPLSALFEPARALLFPGPVTSDDHKDERSPTGPTGA